MTDQIISLVLYGGASIAVVAAIAVALGGL
jgi:hypothetical protein